jgi:hypothetical protein
MKSGGNPGGSSTRQDATTTTDGSEKAPLPSGKISLRTKSESGGGASGIALERVPQDGPFEKCLTFGAPNTTKIDRSAARFSWYQPFSLAGRPPTFTENARGDEVEFLTRGSASPDQSHRQTFAIRRPIDSCVRASRPSGYLRTARSRPIFRLT